MSLKNFHIFFIVVSIIFSVGCGVWCLRSEETTTEVVGVIFLIAAVGLAIYAFKFLKMLRDKRIE